MILKINSDYLLNTINWLACVIICEVSLVSDVASQLATHPQKAVQNSFRNVIMKLSSSRKRKWPNKIWNQVTTSVKGE
jgi:CRISPR/Cas system-associated protein Csx1